MARKDSENQKKSMSKLFRGRAIFKPLNTGQIDDHAARVREWIAIEDDDTEEKARSVKLAQKKEFPSGGAR